MPELKSREIHYIEGKDGYYYQITVEVNENYRTSIKEFIRFTKREFMKMHHPVHTGYLPVFNKEI